ncbi:GNAT family N-acetyltransferase [Allokutzneria albata]|uniref:GNAT family N-acetyltransferase n=1 Tax=Allokutzneria albata TaxID=211114 RepID=UPI0009DCA09C|nr:GNAT family N-acetyltransferase [Allokutzneria albata]
MPLDRLQQGAGQGHRGRLRRAGRADQAEVAGWSWAAPAADDPRPHPARGARRRRRCRGRARARLRRLRVDPERQGKGLGRAIVEPGLAAADAAGVPSSWRPPNAATSPFYERLGFTVTAEVELPDQSGLPPRTTMLITSGSRPWCSRPGGRTP